MMDFIFHGKGAVKPNEFETNVIPKCWLGIRIVNNRHLAFGQGACAGPNVIQKEILQEGQKFFCLKKSLSATG